MLARIRGYYEWVISARGRLSPAEQVNRELIFLTCCLGVILLGCSYSTRSNMSVLLALEIFFRISPITMALCIIGSGCFLNRTHMQILCGGFAVGCILADLGQRSQGSFAWTTLILVVDLGLVLRLNAFCHVTVACVLLWLLMCMIETSTRFGLYDLPGSPSQEARENELPYGESCEKLPCPVAFRKTFYEFVSSVSVFLTDFFITRMFAKQVQQEQNRMQKTVEMVQQIAVLLADYDIDTVAGILADSEGDLPQAVHEALKCIECNLRAYQPYLPQSCFPMNMSGVMSPTGSITDTETQISSIVSEELITSRSRVAKRTFGSLQLREGTLLVVRIANSCEALQEDLRGYTSDFSVLVQEAIASMACDKGIVDFFSGDTVYCSFNMARQCATHANSAVRAAKSLSASFSAMLPSNTATMGIATGRLYCGDIGCPEMRRFLSIGKAVLQAHAVERVCSLMHITVACTAATWLDAECSHAMRLVPRPLRVVAPSLQGNEGSVGAQCSVTHMYEVLLDQADTSVNEEWLYQLDALTKEWSGYNRAVEGYLKGGSLNTAVVSAGAKGVMLREAVARAGSRLDPVVVCM